MKTKVIPPIVLAGTLVLVLSAPAQDLFDAIRQGHIQEVKLLVEKDPRLIQTREEGIYPLHQAVRSGKREIAEYLISKGADMDRFAQEVTEFAPYESTALTEAIRLNNLEMIKMFVDKGADVNKCTSLGESYLHFAVFMNKREIAEYFIDNGIDVNQKKRGDLTPLHLAAVMGFDDLAGMLIEKGAGLNTRSKDGGTPLHFAEAAGHTKTAELLKSKGAEVLPRDFPEYSGAYLGLKTPGSKPEPFTPGLFRDIYRVHSAPAFSPDGKEVFWECIFMTGNNDASRVWWMKEENGRWISPRVASFSAYPSGGPAFFHDGARLVYFSLRPRDQSGQPAKDLDLWVVEREGDGWSDPRHLDTPLNQDGSFEVYPLVATDGTIYLNKGPQGYAKSAFVNGKYGEVEIIGDLFNTDYVDDCRAMEHILFFSDKGRSERFEYEIYISYHQPDGRWSKPVYLGDRLHPGRRATQAVVSLDGKYLFFCSYFLYYWVEAKILEGFAPKEIK
jgi:hypothetical protein